MIYPESPLPVRIKIILSFLIAIFKISASPVYTSVSEDYKHQNTTICQSSTQLPITRPNSRDMYLHTLPEASHQAITRLVGAVYVKSKH